MMTPLEHALAYAALGWRVAPIPPGHKYPHGIPNWQTKATTNSDRLTRHWRRNPDHGVCIATGPESGIFAIDIDPRHGGDDSLHALEAEHGPLPDTITSLTGGGGTHHLYRYPNDRDITNDQSGRLGIGIDIRGINGQIIVAPTVHPETGARYAWEVEHDPLDGYELADAPQWLLDKLTNPTTVEPIRKPRQRLDPNPMPGDWYEASTDWPTELARHGWTHHSTHRHLDGSTYELWTRPGKPTNAGASASLYYRGSNVLKVFTSNAAPLLADHTYTLFGFYAAMHHGGDMAAAARHLRTQMPATTSNTATSTPPRLTIVDPDDLEPDLPDDDWNPHDLAAIATQLRTGQWQPTLPTVLAVTGGIPLFYSGRTNSLFGESGGGKTWAALAAVAETVRNGHRALFIDYEDNPAGIAERLVLLGLTDEQIALVDYRNPATGILRGLDTITDGYHVVIVDSTGEAMAAGGVDSNADREVAQWFAIVKQLTTLPGNPAVIVLDHIPKASDAPTSYAIGSQRKRAAISGAAYRCDTIIEPAKGKNGKLKLTVTKDRPGNRPKGSTACEIDIQSTSTTVTLTAHLSDAQAAAQAGEKFRPTVLMERISRHLENVGPASGRNIEKDVTGKGTFIREALAVLVDEGFVTATPDGYTATIPFRAPVDNPEARPASHRVPTASRDAAKPANGARPASHPLRWDAGRAPSSTPTPQQPPLDRVPVENIEEPF